MGMKHDKKLGQRLSNMFARKGFSLREVVHDTRQTDNSYFVLSKDRKDSAFSMASDVANGIAAFFTPYDMSIELAHRHKLNSKVTTETFYLGPNTPEDEMTSYKTQDTKQEDYDLVEMANFILENWQAEYNIPDHEVKKFKVLTPAEVVAGDLKSFFATLGNPEIYSFVDNASQNGAVDFEISSGKLNSRHVLEALKSLRLLPYSAGYKLKVYPLFSNDASGVSVLSKNFFFKAIGQDVDFNAKDYQRSINDVASFILNNHGANSASHKITADL